LGAKVNGKGAKMAFVNGAQPQAKSHIASKQWKTNSGGLSRSAGGGDAATSFFGAHSRGAAGPSDPALEALADVG